MFCSAKCWTDHNLLCAPLKYAPVVRQRSLSFWRRRCNVVPLADGSFVSRLTDHVVHLVEGRWCSVTDNFA